MLISTPTISVIIPAYNAEKFIGTCIESILSQSDLPDEIIVVNNDSADDTSLIAQRYSQVKVVNEKTRGPSYARNRGAKEAFGEILAFTDADCRVHDDWIIKIKHYYKEYLNIDGIMGYSFGYNESIWAAFFQRASDEFMKEIIRWDNRVCKIDSKNFSIKKCVFEKVCGFNTSYFSSEDVDLGIRLFESGFNVIFANDVNVTHYNPVQLESRIRTRKEQGFYDYRIFKQLGFDRGCYFFPSFKRWYAKYLFVNESSPLWIIKSIICLTEVIIRSIKVLLLQLHTVGMNAKLYYLYTMLMAFVIFKGKLLSRAYDITKGNVQRFSIKKNEFNQLIMEKLT